MSKTKMVLLRVASGVVSSVVGALSGYLVALAVAAGAANGNEDAGLAYSLLLCPPGFLIGATIGAAAGTAVVQKALRQMSSFWKALLGAVVGLMTGGLLAILCVAGLYFVGLWQLGWPFFVVSAIVVCTPMSAGAAIGSGWGATRAAESQV